MTGSRRAAVPKQRPVSQNRHLLNVAPCAPAIRSTSWPSHRPSSRRRSWRCPATIPARGPELLHVTLVSLLDLHYAPPDALSATIAALDSFEGRRPSRSVSTGSKTARRSRCAPVPLAEARAFQKALINHLLACRAPIMLGTTPEPHVTINYKGDRLKRPEDGADRLGGGGDHPDGEHRRQDHPCRAWPPAAADGLRLIAPFWRKHLSYTPSAMPHFPA